MVEKKTEGGSSNNRRGTMTVPAVLNRAAMTRLHVLDHRPS
jgi:hypothetical protein